MIDVFYFMTIWNILWSFSIMYGRLVQFVVICYIFPNLECLDQEKAGNPAQKGKVSSIWSHCERGKLPSRQKEKRSFLFLGLNEEGLPDFSWYKHTKKGKNIPNNCKIPIPNDSKMAK
jgi:hypothetical protein